jgi:hypothetical protein
VDERGLYVDARCQPGPVFLEQLAALIRVVTQKLYDPALIAGTAMITGVLDAVLTHLKQPPYPLFYQMQDHTMHKLLAWHAGECETLGDRFDLALDAYTRNRYFHLYHLGEPLYLALNGTHSPQQVIDTHNLSQDSRTSASIREVDVVQTTSRHFTDLLSELLFNQPGLIFVTTLEPMARLQPIRVRTGQARMTTFFPDSLEQYPRPVTAVVAIADLDPPSVSKIFNSLPY